MARLALLLSCVCVLTSVLYNFTCWGNNFFNSHNLRWDFCEHNSPTSEAYGSGGKSCGVMMILKKERWQILKIQFSFHYFCHFFFTSKLEVPIYNYFEKIISIN